MKPAVLYVAPEVPVPHEGTFLGGSTHVMEVSGALIRNGFTVYVLCRRARRGQPVFEKVSDDLYAYRVYRGLLFPADSGVSRKPAGGRPSLKARLFKLAEKAYFAVVYRSVMAVIAGRLMRKFAVSAVLERNSAKGIGAYPAKLLGVPFVEEVIDPDYSRTAVRMADHVFAYTPKVLGGIVTADRVTFNSAGVDVSLFKPADGSAVRQQYGLAGRHVIAYVGAASAWHGIDVLVRAMKHLPDDYSALVIGQSSEDTLRTAEALGVAGRIKFTGFVKHAEVPAYISAADVAVAPFEPSGMKEMQRLGFYFSPLKIFEYMACARPVVASDVDIVRDIVNGSGCGLLVPPGDAEQLAKAVASIIGSPDMGARMGAAGRKACVERYSWDAVGGEIAGAVRKSITG